LQNRFQEVVGVLAFIADRLAMTANVVGTIVVLLLVAIVNFDMIGRSVFNSPFLGAVEVVQFSMVLIVFLQLPDVVRVNRLTRSDGFLVVIGKRFPRLTAAVTRLIEIVSAVFMALIAIAIWPEFTHNWETQDFFGQPGVFTAPWWPVKLAIFVSATLCTFIFVLKILRPAHKPELVRVPEYEDLP
jgi:TRAP-type C4-dicarboxylate transport system permease small subunit